MRSLHEPEFSLLQSLTDAVNEGDDDKATIFNALNQLLEYTQTHFRNEEALMQRHNYDGYEGHRENHDKLINQVEDLLEDFQEGEPVLIEDYQNHVERHSQLLINVKTLLQEFRDGKLVMTRDVFLFIKSWLANHILLDDIQLSSLINPRQGHRSVD